jgi:septal ring factor EnvC (AmiA/AmiB activator)
MLVMVVPSGAWASQDNLGQRSQELSDVQRRVEALTRDLVQQDAERLALVAELETREREVAQAAIKGRELDRAVTEQTRVAEALRVRHLDESAALDQELAVWADLIRTAYVMGRADRLRLLLNQEDTAKATRILSYFAYLNREQLRRVTTIQVRVERLTRLAHEADREASRLVDLAERQGSAHRQLELARRERAAVLARLETTIASRSADLQGLERDAESLRLLVEHLRQRAQIRVELEIERAAFPDRKGRMAWPLLRGEILAAFGAPKEDPELRWDGVLLSAREGEEVRSVHDGRVIHADWLRGFGLVMVIDHGSGYMSIYGHNQALLKEAGEWVETDEVIALGGSSGGRQDAMLYFAIRHNGTPEDPARWCTDGPHALSHGRFGALRIPLSGTG